MKHEFVAAKDLLIDAVPVKRGAALLTVEVPDGVPLERAIAALSNGAAIPPEEHQQRLAAEQPKK